MMLETIPLPTPKQSEQEELSTAPVPVGAVEEDNPEDYLDGTVDGLSDLTYTDQSMGVPPTDGQLQGAAEQYNMAMITNSRHITPDDVLAMVERDISPYEVQQVLE